MMKRSTSPSKPLHAQDDSFRDLWPTTRPALALADDEEWFLTFLMAASDCGPEVFVLCQRDEAELAKGSLGPGYYMTSSYGMTSDITKALCFDTRCGAESFAALYRYHQFFVTAVPWSKAVPARNTHHAVIRHLRLRDLKPDELKQAEMNIQRIRDVQCPNRAELLDWFASLAREPPVMIETSN